MKLLSCANSSSNKNFYKLKKKNSSQTNNGRRKNFFELLNRLRNFDVFCDLESPKSGLGENSVKKKIIRKLCFFQILVFIYLLLLIYLIVIIACYNKQCNMPCKKRMTIRFNILSSINYLPIRGGRVVVIVAVFAASKRIFLAKNPAFGRQSIS